MASRVSSRPAPVRNGFIERLAGQNELPPLAFMLRGGQGGEVRLKLLLSLLWFSVKNPHDTSYPARGWAALLDLPEPDSNGARRVTAALDWLEEHRFVRLERRRGEPTTVYLLDERGSGLPYRLPFHAYDEKQQQGIATDRDDYWVGLPSSFWTKGWIGVLSAPAVAMLLVLMDESAMRRTSTALWQSPAQAAKRFGMSEDTRSAGLIELDAYGVVSTRRTSISPGVFDFKRLRNVYDLHLEQLTVEPGTPRPTELLTVQEVAAASQAADEALEAGVPSTEVEEPAVSALANP